MVYNNFLTDEELKQINDLREADIWHKPSISPHIPDYRILKGISIIDHLENIKTKIWEKISVLSEYNIDGIYEMHMLKYDVGGKYDWHQDVVYRNEPQRKHTFILQISDHDDYEGGDLEFFPTIKIDIDKERAREKGTLIVFSSYLYHRITPITKGHRYSIVGWVSGPPWK